MYAEVLEIKTKPGQAPALCAVIEQRATPILEKYSDFVDNMCLLSEESPNEMLAITVWKSKAAADRLNPEDRVILTAYYRPFLDGEFKMRGYDIPLALVYDQRAAKDS